MRFLFPLLLLAGCQSASLTAAKIYLKENDVPRAKEQLDKALADSPEDPEVHFLIGRIAAAERQYAKMDSAFKASWRLGSEFRPQIERLRRQYWAREHNDGLRLIQAPSPRYDAAMRAFGNAIIIDPRPLASWHSIAHVYYQLDSLDRAAGIYDHILAAVPDDTTSLEKVSAVYLEQGRHQEAVRTLVRLLELTPGDVSAHINLGTAYERLDRPSEARQSYLQAIRLDPRNALAHYNLGNIYWNRADYEAARQEYERAVELAPDDDDARFNLVMAYLGLDQLDKALSLLEELARRTPDSAEVWQELGRVYATQGMVEKSQQAFARARAALDRSGSEPAATRR